MAMALPEESVPGPSGYSEKSTAGRVVDVGICWKVASCIGKQWKWLGRSIGLADAKLENIEERYRNDREEIAYQMLLVWKETKSLEATVDTLVQHLKEVDRVDLASEILKIAEESPTTPQMPQISQAEKRSLNKSELQEHCSPTPPISQEDINRTWIYLKAMLQTEHRRQKIPKIPWLNNWELNFEDYYVDLTIKYKNDKETRPLNLHEIFKSSEGNIPNSSTRILIEGPAGYGKSTLARKLCFDQSHEEEYIRRFEAIILISLRDFKGNLEEMITNTLQFCDYNPECVYEAIKQNQSKTLFILDGFDELPKASVTDVITLLKGKQLPLATVIVTSRLGYIELENEDAQSSITNLLHCVENRVLIKGITGESRIKFLQLYLKGYPSEKFTSLRTLGEKKFGLSKTEDENLFDCPLFLLLLVLVSEETEISSFETKTQLYKHLFNFILQRMWTKKSHTGQTSDFFSFDENNPPAYVELLSQFGSLAGEGLRQQKYSFTEGQILRICGNDNLILKLGILTQTDRKIGKTRTALYEPVHLSFLEFSFAYHFWISLKRKTLFTFLLQEKFGTGLLHSQSLVMPFLFGLFGQQFRTLTSILMHDDYGWLDTIANFCDYNELLADCKLKPSELVKVFLDFVPTDYVKQSGFKYVMPLLIKRTLMHAVETRRNQRASIMRYFSANSEQYGGLPLQLISSRLWNSISQDWRQFITNHNLIIYYPTKQNIIFQITIYSSHPDEQRIWLSKWLTFITRPVNEKPIHKICYFCSESQLEETLNVITDLIRQEKVESVSIVSRFTSVLPVEPWKEFIHCANQSQKLLDLHLHVRSNSPLFVDLGSEEGKTWRNLEFEVDVIPRAGSPVDIWDLESFIRNLPSRIHTLRLNSRLFSYKPSYVFVQSDDAHVAHNLRELRMVFSNDAKSLLESRIWRYLKNLQVLAIGLSTGFRMDEQVVITFIMFIISHCRLLVRLEFWEGCTEEFIATFFQCLRKSNPQVVSNQDQCIWTNLHLDTLMLSPLVSSRNEMPETTTVNLAKELLLSGRLWHLWICCTVQKEGYAKQEFLREFSPEEGFICEQEFVLCNKNAVWGFTHWINIAVAKSLGHKFSFFSGLMSVYKITAQDRK